MQKRIKLNNLSRQYLFLKNLKVDLNKVIKKNNFILGEDANFWYLKKRPDGASLLDLFPDPPFHILVTIPVAIVMFYLIYLPLGIKDWISKNK